MAKAYRVTAKRTINGSKGIQKGMSAQVAAGNGGGKPSPTNIVEAFEKQLGTVVKGVVVNGNDFDFEVIG